MKHLLHNLMPKSVLSRGMLYAGAILMAACYLLAVILMQSAEALTDLTILSRTVPALLETAPGCLAAGFTAAVLIEISARDTGSR